MTDTQEPGPTYLDSPGGDGATAPASPSGVPPGVPAGEPARSPRRSFSGVQVLAVVVIAALVGSAAAIGVARWTGWGTTTVPQGHARNTSTIANRPSDIQGILAEVLPSVVSITATSTQPSATPVAGSSTATSLGTGVVVSRGGEVVTNDHVVTGASSIRVTLDGSRTSLRATLVGAAPAHDLALLQIGGNVDLRPVTFADSTRVVVGDEVLAVGYALGLSGGPTVTDGIISATGRKVVTSSEGTTVTLTGMLQTDAAISSGNSGGPLVDSSARVVGINTAVATSTDNATAQNIGFAIPSSTVEDLLPSLRNG